MVRLPNERRNCLNLSSTMRRFSEVIDELQLRDLLLVGGSYTWCGGLNNRSASRLDRFLVSEDWESHFSNLSQSLLPKPTSDHAPILLDGGGISGKKNPFLLRKYVVESGGLHRPSQGVVVLLQFQRIL